MWTCGEWEDQGFPGRGGPETTRPALSTGQAGPGGAGGRKRLREGREEQHRGRRHALMPAQRREVGGGALCSDRQGQPAARGSEARAGYKAHSLACSRSAKSAEESSARGPEKELSAPFLPPTLGLNSLQKPRPGAPTSLPTWTPFPGTGVGRDQHRSTHRAPSPRRC